MPPRGFEDHMRDHPKDQSPAPGKEDPRPKIIFAPSKVSPPMTRDTLRSIIANLEAADMGVKNAAKEVSKVRMWYKVKTTSNLCYF